MSDFENIRIQGWQQLWEYNTDFGLVHPIH